MEERVRERESVRIEAAKLDADRTLVAPAALALLLPAEFESWRWT